MEDKNIKWINGYEGLYQIDIYGNVYSCKRNTAKGGKLIPQVTSGYFRVALSKNGIIKRCFVHRLVAEAFRPNPNNYPQVNHKDENRQNNCVDNLEWCTQLYNVNYGTGIARNIQARLGVKHTEERKAKISKALKGRKPPVLTEDGRRRCSEAAKLEWQRRRNNV